MTVIDPPAHVLRIARVRAEIIVKNLPGFARPMSGLEKETLLREVSRTLVEQWSEGYVAGYDAAEVLT